MTIEWLQSAKYVRGEHEWVGRIEFQGSSVEVACKNFSGYDPPDGEIAAKRLVGHIEKTLTKAVANHERDLSILSEAFGELYNQHWRPKRGRNLAPDKIGTELNLDKINLAQGITRNQYQLIFAPIKKRFRDYLPYSEVDLGKVRSALLKSPRDENHEDLLPFLGEIHYAKLPAGASQRVANRVPLTKQTKKFKWVTKLSYDAKAKQWIDGEVEFQKKRYEITVNAPKKDDPESWVDLLLSKILTQLSAATKEASHQLAKLYNDTWMEDRELSATAIKRRIKLQSMTLSRDESWQMWFADDDLFGGHWINVSIDTNGEVTFTLSG